MNKELVNNIQKALLCSWSRDTSICYTEDAPASYGQCAQTAIIICEKFGGEILKTDGWPPVGRHFYNRIDGIRYDFTSDQFKTPEDYHKIQYKDFPSSIEEAMTETLPKQIESMRDAFDKAFGDNLA